MDIKNLVMAVVGMVLAAVMVGGALLPAIGSAGKVSYTNDYGSMANYSDTNWSATFSTDGTTATWSVDGVDQTEFRMSKAGRVFLVMSDEFTLFFDQNVSGGVPVGGISYKKNNVSIGVNNILSCDVSMTDGVITCTSIIGGETSTPITTNSNWVFVAKDLGEYRSFNLSNFTSAKIYYTSINQIYGVNYVGTTGNVWFSFNGNNVKYGDTSLKMNITSEKIGENVYSSTVNTTSSDWQFTVDNNGSDYSVNPYVWIVPYRVTGYADGFTISVNAMFGALPVVAIAGLVLAGIYVFISRK